MKDTKSGLILIFGFFFVIILFANFPSIIAENENTAIRGDRITITAILLQNGTYGIPIPNQVIEFYDQTMNSYINYGITDDTGIVSIHWNIPNDYPLGPTVINATYRGNESLFLAPSCQWVTINILSSTLMTVNNNEDVVAPGDYFSFAIHIFNDTLDPIQDATISVYANDILLATAVTNSSGGAFFLINCNTSWSNLGDNIIHVIFEQDLENYYSRAESIFVIKVQKLDTQINIESFTGQPILGDTLDATITLNCTEGGVFAALDIILDEHYLTTINTNDQGSCNLNLDIDDRYFLGQHSLRIIYNGNERYSESIIFRQFDVFGFVHIECEANIPVIIGSAIELNIKANDILNRPILGILYISDQTDGHNISIQIPTNTNNVKIPFPVINQAGLHNLSIKIENSFVINGTLSYSFIAWSLPKIELLKINVIHYASPNQEIMFLVHLTDFSGNISHKDIQLLLDSSIVQSFFTDINGTVTFTINAPSIESNYNYSIYCSEDTKLFELAARLDYHVIVTKQIPIMVNLIHYEIISPLQMIEMKLQIICLNGSLLKGLSLEFLWLSIEKSAITKDNGEIILQLPLPSTSGNCSLYYEIKATKYLAYSSGTIILSIPFVSILAAQGIGIGGFAITFTVTSILFAIPIIRQRFTI